MKSKLFLSLSILICAFMSLTPRTAQAQKNIRDSSVFFYYLGAHGGIHWPGADMAKRFGANLHLGASIGLKTKANWLMELGGSFITGNIIRETGFLQNLATSNGFVIDISGQPADLRINERGYHLYLAAGKLLPFLSPNPNSGFVIKAGGGFLLHRIRITDLTNSTPQIRDEYEKGYDRFTYGPMAYQYIGYQYHSNRRLINFSLGFEFVEGFTKGQRPVNFDTQKSDLGKSRKDFLYGLRLGWVFPLYKKTPNEFYYN